MRAVIILSGGMDSATLLAKMCHEQSDIQTLTFDYGSKHNKVEIGYAKELAYYYKVPHQIIELPFINRLFKSDLLKSGGKIPEGHYEDEVMRRTVVPFRNGIMLSIAVGYAESIGFDAVAIGNHSGDHCLIGTTRISLLNGTEMMIKDLVSKGEVWVYSYDVLNERVVPGKAIATKTRRNAALVEVLLDNGELVVCTPDHLFLLRSGIYKQASSLNSGDSLMPLYRKVDEFGYELFWNPKLARSGRRWTYTHKRMFGSVTLEKIIHHIDFNCRNNCPPNLRELSVNDHLELHRAAQPTRKKRRKSAKSYWSRVRCGEILRLPVSESTRKLLSKATRRYFTTASQEQLLERARKISVSRTGIPRSKELKDRLHTVMRGRCFGPVKHTERTKQKMSLARKKYYENPLHREEQRKRKLVGKNVSNHSVVSVKRLFRREDTYDLTVEKHHNFAISAGAFLHNSIYPDCRSTFIGWMNQAAMQGTYAAISICSPFIQITKSHIVRIGASLQVPYKDTYSCYNGGVVHCGKCGTCVERKEAFKDANIFDPTTYKE